MRKLRRYAGRIFLGLLILAMLSVLIGGLVLSCMPKNT